MVGEFYEEETPLLWLCGDSSRIRLLSVFVDEQRTEISRYELVRRTGVTRERVDNHLEDFVKIGLVEQTAQSGHSRWYQLSEDSPIAEQLDVLNDLTLHALLDQGSDSQPDLSESSTQIPSETRSFSTSVPLPDVRDR